MMHREFIVLGLMSGTSLDGLDIAACTFRRRRGKWNFVLHQAKSFPYSTSWKKKLRNAPNLSPENLDRLDEEYATHLAGMVTAFCQAKGLKPQLIASHGHTVYHEPEKGITRQIGSGEVLSFRTNVSVVYDFRSLDVQKGGQGAPLVPAGDKLLFGDYGACLNLGGFSNISFDRDNQRLAFDICPVNTALNFLAGKAGSALDKDGEMGRRGRVDKELLHQLDQLVFYRMDPPKSLSREWLEHNFLPLLQDSGLTLNDQAATIYQHIIHQINHVFNKYGIPDVLVSGGGAMNTYLLDLLQKTSPAEIKLPDKKIIDFKEAVIFAFLGYLRYIGEINCYASVTGAYEDSVVGTLINKEPRKTPGLRPN